MKPTKKQIELIKTAIDNNLFDKIVKNDIEKNGFSNNKYLLNIDKNNITDKNLDVIVNYTYTDNQEFNNLVKKLKNCMRKSTNKYEFMTKLFLEKAEKLEIKYQENRKDWNLAKELMNAYESLAVYSKKLTTDFRIEDKGYYERVHIICTIQASNLRKLLERFNKI